MQNESNGATAPIPNVQLEAATLLGDVRDALLAEFKAIDKPWSKMTEDEQGRLILRADDIAGDLVHGAVGCVAHHGFSHVGASLEQFTRKDGLKITLKSAATVDHITKLAEHGMNSVVLVFAEPAKFMGERKPAEPDNVGDLAIPKMGQGAPSDPDALETVGRGKNAKPKRNGKPPKADLANVDVSERPFGIPDEPRTAHLD